MTRIMTGIAFALIYLSLVIVTIAFALELGIRTNEELADYSDFLVIMGFVFFSIGVLFAKDFWEDCETIRDDQEEG